MIALKTTTRITKTPRLAATRVTPSSRLSLDSELLPKFVQDNSNRSSSNKERYQNQFKTRQINPSKGKIKNFRRLTAAGTVLS
jgi:hypothetical protein